MRDPTIYGGWTIYRQLSEWVELLKSDEPICQVGYSDAEWYCILGKRIGDKTGLGQVLTSEQGEKLFDVIRRRWDNPHWCFAMPKALWTGEVPATEGNKVGQYLLANGIPEFDYYERDLFTDDAARQALLFPLVKYLFLEARRPMVIGPKPLMPLFNSTPYDLERGIVFVGIPSPNLHLNWDITNTAIVTAGSLIHTQRVDTVFISAGVSAATLADSLYDHFPDVNYFDCGSIWDAFVGIGGQRQWRADLYANPKRHAEWKHQNFQGVPDESH